MVELAQATEVILTRPPTLEVIESLDSRLALQLRRAFSTQPALTRQLVSFQANKARPAYRWYKFKEAFSAALVEYLLDRYRIRSGRILDPFAGSGTALFGAAARGLDADGIEVLPIGRRVIEGRLALEHDFSADDWAALTRWTEERPWQSSDARVALPRLRITERAYPARTQDDIERYLGAAQNESQQVQTVLEFALLCVLESISYTRKDGQYLRWDHRSGRRHGKVAFEKGPIVGLSEAIIEKLTEIISDLAPDGPQLGLFPAERSLGNIRVLDGSCLEVMPLLPERLYDAVITSPPYCNRYDYTRTYALELALLGVDEGKMSSLRQRMLTCTVENRAKDLLAINREWAQAIAAADQQELLQAILSYLEYQRTQGRLNNSGIPRMVRGYFYEMACVIAECARVLKPDAPLLMVNDNVRYAGASISVDMILSAIAERLGFRVESILVLPNGKGNSSQQMGAHGRSPLRKCVYVWRRV